MTDLEAVIFDWGGTLTRWHDIDFHAESLALAAAVTDDRPRPRGVAGPRCTRRANVIWGRSRDHQQSATIADLFDEAGLDHDPELLTAYREFWEPHTYTDPDARPAARGAAGAAACKIGVLSNTIWPRAWHVAIFERDGVSTTWSTATSTPARSRGRSRRPTRSGPPWTRSG